MGRFTASINDNLKDRLPAYAQGHGYDRTQALEVIIRVIFEDVRITIIPIIAMVLARPRPLGRGLGNFMNHLLIGYRAQTLVSRPPGLRKEDGHVLLIICAPWA